MHLALVRPLPEQPREREQVSRSSPLARHRPLEAARLGFESELGLRLEAALAAVERRLELLDVLIEGHAARVAAMVARLPGGVRPPRSIDLAHGGKSPRSRPEHVLAALAADPSWRPWTGFRRRPPAAITSVAQALAAGRSPSPPSSAWLMLAAHARRMRVMQGPDAEDALQNTLLAIFEHAPTEQLANPIAWLRTVARNEVIDLARRNRKHQSPIDSSGLTAPDDPTSYTRAQTVALLAGVEAAIAVAVSGDDAARGRAQMRAVLARSLGASIADVREEAQLPARMSDDLVSKWIERGREPLLELLGAIGRRADADGIGALRVMVDARRADAGEPRPARRKGAA